MPSCRTPCDVMVQKFGNIAWKTSHEDTVKILLSKYGLKVTDARKHVRDAVPRSHISPSTGGFCAGPTAQGWQRAALH